MKKVLFISYAFPPVGGAGVQRISKFVKYLPANGWMPSVLTVSNPSAPTTDITLLKDIPNGVQIFKAKTLEPAYSKKAAIREKAKDDSIWQRGFKKIIATCLRSFLIPDPQILWWPHASIAVRKILKNSKFDVIFASGPPFSLMILAIFWGKRYKIPVVVDFRDEWTFSRSTWENAPKSKLIRWVDKIAERWVVNNATAITLASPGYLPETNDECQHAKIVSVITNGYDPDDFEGIDDRVLSIMSERRNLFTLLYAGTVWKATSLRYVAKAIEELLGFNPKLRDIFRLRIVGRVVSEEVAYLKILEDLGVVEMIGYVEHDMVSAEMMAADALLLTLSDLPGAEKIIPGKTFEYMSCSSPILSITPAGACSKIIKDADNIFWAKPNDTGRITNYLQKIVTLPVDKNLRKRREADRYGRVQLTGLLANVLSDAANLSKG